MKSFSLSQCDSATRGGPTLAAGILSRSGPDPRATRLFVGRPQFIELLADDFVEHEELPGLASGREGVRQLFTMLQAAFPDMRWEADDVLVDGEKVVPVSG